MSILCPHKLGINSQIILIKQLNTVRYIDLHLQSGESALVLAQLLKRYASNINYIYFLPESFERTFILQAATECDDLINNVRFIGRKFEHSSLWQRLRLMFLVRKLEPQIVLMHGMIRPANIILVKIILGNKAKIIVQNHADRPAQSLRVILQKMADVFISGYLFVSEKQAEPWIKSGVIGNRSKVHEVMEGSTSFKMGNRFEAKKQLGAINKLLFLWVGRLDHNKDPLTVLQAFKNYVVVNQGAHLWMIYGTTELLGEVKKYILENDLGAHVSLIGQIDHSLLEQYYNAADYFILGSHYEGSGYALCEAMACGCIPIVTKIPSFVKMLNNGDCGHLYSPGSSSELTEVLKKVEIDNPEVLRKKVLKKFEEDLSFEAIARGIAKVTLSLTK